MARSNEQCFGRYLGVVTLMMLAAGHASAHEPVAMCVLLDASTIRCRGTSNDGDELRGARMEVTAHDGSALLDGRLDAQSTFTFAKPRQPFYVLLDTGPGLQAIVEQEEIKPVPARKARWMQR